MKVETIARVYTHTYSLVNEKMKNINKKDSNETY